MSSQRLDFLESFYQTPIDLVSIIRPVCKLDTIQRNGSKKQ